MKYKLLLKNVKTATSENPVDIAVAEGKIAAIAAPGLLEGELERDFSGKYALPGMIDLHVHLREPGFEYKEDILSGTKCAAAGGVTSVFCMPNTKPATDSPEILSHISERAKSASARVFPVAAITKGLASEEINDLVTLAKSGAYAFSDDGKPVMTAAMLRDAMKLAEANDLLLMSHCEEMTLAGGAMNEGETSEKLGVKGTPNTCEDIATMRDIALAEETGCRLHICHVSTRGSLEAIRAAKARGVNVTAETCPHYFILTDEAVESLGANAKMNPPLRSEADRLAVLEAILDGTLDCISTDHAPHSDDEKAQGLVKAPNGIIGLQTSFIASYTHLVRTGLITLERLTELMAKNPAKITGLDKLGLGSLAVGNPADIAIVSLDNEYTLERGDLAGKSHNTPFIGTSFDAKVEATLVNGKFVF